MGRAAVMGGEKDAEGGETRRQGGQEKKFRGAFEGRFLAKKSNELKTMWVRYKIFGN